MASTSGCSSGAGGAVGAGASVVSASDSSELERLRAQVAELKKGPRVGVGVFVLAPDHPGCVLMGERAGSLGSGMFALPGGHLEYGESFQECALRELLEETDLVGADAEFVTANNNVFKDAGKHYVTVFVKVHVAAGSTAKRTEPEKCLGWSWVPIDDIGRGKQAGRAFLPLQMLVDKLRDAEATGSPSLHSMLGGGVGDRDEATPCTLSTDQASS